MKSNCIGDIYTCRNFNCIKIMDKAIPLEQTELLLVMELSLQVMLILLHYRSRFSFLGLISNNRFIGGLWGNSGYYLQRLSTQYWHVDAGSWSDASKWFLATNGGGGAGRIPLPQDNYVFDDNSADSNTKNIAMDEDYWHGKSGDFSAIDITGATFQQVSVTTSYMCGGWDNRNGKMARTSGGYEIYSIGVGSYML